MDDIVCQVSGKVGELGWIHICQSGWQVIWSKHRRVKTRALKFWGKAFCVLIFVCNILERVNFHHLKTLQIIAGTLRIIFPITHVSVSECLRLLALWFLCIQSYVPVLTMRGKQEGGGGDSPNPPEAWRGSHTAQTPFTVKKQLPLRLCSGETDSNYSFLSPPPSTPPQPSLARREPHDGKPRERKTSPPPLSYFLRKRHLPPPLGEVMIVYFEWCAIMTVQQITVT